MGSVASVKGKGGLDVKDASRSAVHGTVGMSIG